jgi:agmatine deiminase
MYAYNQDLAALELFYADLCREIARHDELSCLVPDEAHAKKMVRLSGLDAGCFPKASLPDIWIRDFGPLVATDRYVKFRYAPAYSRKRFNAEVDAAARDYLSRQAVPMHCEELALEGGNFVHNGAGIGIATRKIFSMNRRIPRPELVRRLEQALGLKRLVVVPLEPEDRTGHVDGMLRWASEKALLLNDYSRLEWADRFRTRLTRVLERELPHVEKLLLPYCASSARRDGWYDARGNYANFLLTKNRAYVPCYGLPEDDSARRVFEGIFPGRVSCIDARPVSRYGGSLNCITWNHG